MAVQERGKREYLGHENRGFSRDPDDKIQTKPGDDADSELDEPVDKSFGCWICKNQCLGRCLSNLYFFAFLLGNAALLPAAGLKSISINLQSLKTQFNLSDEEAADMQMANSIGLALSSIISGYIGSFHKAHIPALVGVTAFFNGIALMAPSFLQFASPYHIQVDPITANCMYIPFLCHSLPPVLPTTIYGSNMTTFIVPTNGCNMTTSLSQQDHLPTVDMTGYIVLVFAQAMSGLLLPMTIVLAPVYMDNNEVNKSKLGIFIGIYTLFLESSSIAGLSVSGFLASNPVDFNETRLNTQDPRFVGAWWLPLLLFGGALVWISTLIMQFPKRLISKRRQRQALAEAALSFAAQNVAANVLSDSTDGSSKVPEGKGEGNPIPANIVQEGNGTGSASTDNQASLHQFPPSLKGKRPSIIDSIVYDSIAIPRYGLVHGIRDFPIQVYRVIKNPIFLLFIIDAALLAIPLKGSELFRQSYQIFEFSLGLTAVTTASMAYSVTNILGVIAGAAICWKIRTLKGYALTILAAFGLCSVIAPLYFVLGCDNQDLYGFQGKYGVPLPNVTAECLCYPGVTMPTCGDDGRSYASPCYAGCLAGDGFDFQNCTHLSTSEHGQGARSLTCDAGCFKEFVGYTIVLSLLTFFTEMAVVPRSLLIIRMVEPRDRAFATSLFIFFSAVFSIPAPKIFGHIFEDVGCLATSGNVCVLYDRKKIRYLMSGMELSVYVILFLTSWLMLLIFKMMDRKVMWKSDAVRRQESREPITARL